MTSTKRSCLINGSFSSQGSISRLCSLHASCCFACLLTFEFWVGRYILDVVVNPPQRDRLVPPIFYAEFQKLSDWMVVVELRIKLVMHATTYIYRNTDE